MVTPLQIHIKESDINVQFKKLSNQKWSEIHEKYSPISEDYDLLIHLGYHHYPKTDFDLAKMYMTLFTVFGPHNGYDDYKCSFSYRLGLEINRNGKTYHYGLAIMDMKGGMPYFTYYRKPVGDENPDAYQKPIDEEFTKEEMRQCTLSLVVFLENFFDAYQPFFNQNFFRVIPYCYTIYGFQKGKFFVTEYPSSSDEDYEKFQKKIKSFQKKKLFDTPMSIPFWSDEEVRDYFNQPFEIDKSHADK